MRPRNNTFVQYWHTPAMQAFPHWGTSRPEHPSCGGKSGCSIATANQIGWIQIYQMERCSGRLHWHWQSWILCWQSFRAKGLDGFIDIGRFNFRFSTSSSQSPFYLQAAEEPNKVCWSWSMQDSFMQGNVTIEIMILPAPEMYPCSLGEHSQIHRKSYISQVGHLLDEAKEYIHASLAHTRDASIPSLRDISSWASFMWWQKRTLDSHCKPNWLDWAFLLTLVANLWDGALLKTIALLCISHSHFWRCKNWKRLMWSPWQK